jgi:hypothetical protein
VWNKELTNVACLSFTEQMDHMQLDNTVYVPLLVPNPEQNRLVMAVVQKYTDQAHSSSHHSKSYNKGRDFPLVYVIYLYLEYYWGEVAS